MVLSYAFWTRVLARDPRVLGMTIDVKGVPFTVVGVAARGFFGVGPATSTDFWVPLQMNPALNAWDHSVKEGLLYGSPSWWCLRMVARLAPGVTPQQAQAAAAGVYLSAAEQGVGSIHAKQWRPLLAFNPVRGVEQYQNFYKQPIEVLMGLVLVILLIAVTNVAMMIRARNAARSREFALRLSLGAKRSRLLVQLLIEGGILVAIGSSLGWAFAEGATTWLAKQSQIASGVAPDGAVLLFTAAVSVLAVLLCGLAPLRLATRAPMAAVLRSGGTQHTPGRRAALTGSAALVVQVALCMVLLLAGSLLLRTLLRYHDQPLGMDANHLLAFGLTPGSRRPQQQQLVFYRTLLERIEWLPGVRAASMADLRPGSGWVNGSDVTLDGVHRAGATLLANFTGAGYFRTVGTPLLAGREFTMGTALTPRE